MICNCESNCSLLRTLGHHCDINSNELVMSCHENLLLHGRPTESCNFIMQQHNEFVFNACCNTDLRALVGMMAGVFTFYLCFSGSILGPRGEIGKSIVKSRRLKGGSCELLLSCIPLSCSFVQLLTSED